jgi:hypothetical protein
MMKLALVKETLQILSVSQSAQVRGANFVTDCPPDIFANNAVILTMSNNMNDASSLYACRI